MILCRCDDNNATASTLIYVIDPSSLRNNMAFFHSNFMLQTPNPETDHHHHHHHHHHHSTSLPPLIPPPNCNNPQQFHGSLVGKRSSMSLMEDMNSLNNHGEDELSDDGSQVGEKKRRLNMEQVRTLEKNFEMGSKLEPERKMQLARALGLQPRQIAIWFQNRRARWKTKQLEKDYDALKRQFEAVMAQNEVLQAQNHKLHSQILALQTREPIESINLNKETEGSCSNRSENTSEIKLDMSTTQHDDGPPLSGHTPRPAPPTAVALFQNPASANKIDQNVKEESLCNMFCGMDDHAGFWPWLEQHHFN